MQILRFPIPAYLGVLQIDEVLNAVVIFLQKEKGNPTYTRDVRPLGVILGESGRHT